jgi:hypothetical protein
MLPLWVYADMVAEALAETVARRDAGVKPTRTYLRRVSAQGLGNHGVSPPGRTRP